MNGSLLQNFSNLEKAKILLLFLFGISLPFKDQFSTIISLALLLLTLFIYFKDNKHANHKKYLPLVLIPGLLIIPRLIGIITGDFDLAIKELVRALPLILIPLIFILGFPCKKTEKYFYYGLLLGLLLFMLICECHVIYKMIKGHEPFEYFFRWRHLNVNFVKPLDIHPPYVAILVIWLMVKTIYKNYLVIKSRYFLLAVFALFLFQLLARNAIIVAILVTLYYSIRKFNFKKIILVVSSITLLFVVVIYHPHDYLRNKIINSLNPLDNQNKDKRIIRLNASIEVFKSAPIIGVGPENDNKLRKVEYKKMGDFTAFDNNYNSHNQFFEYLVSNGIIGLSCFISLLLLLIKMTIKNKDYTNLMLIGCFIISCLTESILERTLGIKYFSILIAFILLNHVKQERPTSLKKP